MKVTRRTFLKMSGALTGYLLTGPSLWGGSRLPAAYADVGPKTGTESTSICCFCGVGCGAVVTASAGKIVAVEGDPVHPINEGALCSKGQAMYQTANQTLTAAELAAYPVGAQLKKWPDGKRLARVLWRPANTAKWQVISWDTAMDKIATKVADARSASWEGATSRTRAIAALGGSAHDNQECYLLQKLYRGLGLVWIDTQARI